MTEQMNDVFMNLGRVGRRPLAARIPPNWVIRSIVSSPVAVNRHTVLMEFRTSLCHHLTPIQQMIINPLNSIVIARLSYLRALDKKFC